MKKSKKSSREEWDRWLEAVFGPDAQEAKYTFTGSPYPVDTAKREAVDFLGALLDGLDQQEARTRHRLAPELFADPDAEDEGDDD